MWTSGLNISGVFPSDLFPEVNFEHHPCHSLTQNDHYRKHHNVAPIPLLPQNSASLHGLSICVLQQWKTQESVNHCSEPPTSHPAMKPVNKPSSRSTRLIRTTLYNGPRSSSGRPSRYYALTLPWCRGRHAEILSLTADTQTEHTPVSESCLWLAMLSRS